MRDSRSMALRFMVGMAGACWWCSLVASTGCAGASASYKPEYVSETIKLLPQTLAPIVIAQIFDHMARLGSVHNAEPAEAWS